MSNSTKKQKWEYAHILYSWSSDKHVSLTYLNSNGPDTKTLKKGGFFSGGDPGFREQIWEWITQLGQDGYEMIGFTIESVGNEEHYWFKRQM
jgi:hypothetical protein